ncbi:rRNA-binding ribosome biosynthesis protein NOP15 KNAG_0I02030 [Huiozyma naganishii CBS 8797]|uniref:RRM domain-containing protein n=1 Tax=Huiozyma naganishii (strain ATCC MYA-139 / BCRC 22969 / CBS 8797 / KCTC 17520 / NBRC 10181 / NCYC 3082 / Yp74L-3) TaxID=1071383 RepID=J7RQE5_HUIN7|nr:hypothetical protein KNAG_0I02030 [Kazachstania naganishii CBS 8797]CCK71988.1 hypothetical protein KNAG_0I02030 [Kazachstania naganishii CBS 8797]
MVKSLSKKGRQGVRAAAATAKVDVEDDSKVSVESSQSSEEEEMEGLSDLEAEAEAVELSGSEEDTVSGDKRHKIKKLSNKRRDTAAAGGKSSGARDEHSSILYVSRLPHGFHERELSRYFSQFGDLKEVRLARNKKTGNSRHYGFIEFAEVGDAQVAQETMNNYLLMGHLLQVRLLGKGSKIEKLYKYKKRAFSETPVKKSKKELKQKAAEKQSDRFTKLEKAGIAFKW